MTKASQPRLRWGPIPHDKQRRSGTQTRYYNHPRWNWSRRRRVRRGLITIYLVTLTALAAIGWDDARHADVSGKLWFVLFVAILAEQAVLEKATRGLFRLRADVLDERQRAVRDLGYRYAFRILAAAATAIAVTAVWLPVDRLPRAADRLEGTAVTVAVVYLLWMLPTAVIAWIEPDDPALDRDDQNTAPATPLT